MWFTNLWCYQLTQAFTFNTEQLEKHLSEYRFQPCLSSDLHKLGWVPALGESSKNLVHQSGDFLLVSLQKEDKLLPASVINTYTKDKVKVLELAENRKITRSEQGEIKENIISQLLPRAFSRYQQTHGIIDLKNNMIMVNSSSSQKAEELLAMLRKALESLPVTPLLGNNDITATLIDWIKNEPPTVTFTLGNEVELKGIKEDTAISRFKGIELTTEEIQHQLTDKVATQLRMIWQEKVEFTLTKEMALKRIKYIDLDTSEIDDIPYDEELTKADMTFALVAGELSILIQQLMTCLELENKTEQNQ